MQYPLQAALNARQAPVKSLATALQVLSRLAEQREMSVSALSRRLALPKSQVSRVLSTFRQAGLVAQNPADRTYRIGLRAYTIGCRYLAGDRLAGEAPSLLRAAADRTGFTATLSVLDDTRPLYLIGVEGSISVEFGSQVGAYFPVHATAPGRVLAAFCARPLRERMLAEARLEKLTPNTIASLSALRRELGAVAKQGFAISNGDRGPGIGGIAVPVFGQNEQLVGALGLVYPLARMAAERHPYFVAILHDLARILSLRLSAQAYPFGSGDQLLRSEAKSEGASA